MLKEHTQKVLQDFANSVYEQAKANNGDNVKGWGSEIKVSENSITLALEMAEYLHYQDAGVHGITSSPIDAKDSKFQFGSGKGKKGLRAAILNWVTSKRKKLRNNNY